MDERNTIMKKYNYLCFLFSCYFQFHLQLHKQRKHQKETNQSPAVKDTLQLLQNLSITFIELGSVKCIPCEAMQPVMKAIEEKYGDQIKVVFYDVWKQEQAHFAQDYNIRLIPTQVFLDAKAERAYAS